MMNPLMNDYYSVDKVYYTFEDLLKLNSPQYLYPEDEYTELKGTPMEIRTSVLGWSVPQYLPTLNKLNSYLTDDKTLELWEYLKARYLKEYIAESDEEYKFVESGDVVIHENVQKVFGSFWRQFEAILTTSFPRYSKLLTLYKEHENALLDKLKSISSLSGEGSSNETNTTSGTTNNKSRKNTVPQTSSVDPYDSKFASESDVGDTSNTSSGTNQAHSTNNSTNTSETDPMPIMERLESIRQKWYSIIEEWANEFNPLFIENI